MLPLPVDDNVGSTADEVRLLIGAERDDTAAAAAPVRPEALVMEEIGPEVAGVVEVAVEPFSERALLAAGCCTRPPPLAAIMPPPDEPTSSEPAADVGPSEESLPATTIGDTTVDESDELAAMDEDVSRCCGTPAVLPPPLDGTPITGEGSDSGVAPLDVTRPPPVADDALFVVPASEPPYAFPPIMSVETSPPPVPARLPDAIMPMVPTRC